VDHPGVAGDYNEKTWPQNYSIGVSGTSRAEKISAPRRRLPVGPARRKGLWIVNFGEMTESDDGDSKTVLAGPHQHAGLESVTATNYPGFVPAIAGHDARTAVSPTRWRAGTGKTAFPDLVILWLRATHARRRASRPTPRGMVADNDLALG